MFTADGPLGPSWVSNCTRSPSVNVARPAAVTADMCTKTSRFSVAMNPKPLEALNHFTVPVLLMCLLFLSLFGFISMRKWYSIVAGGLLCLLRTVRLLLSHGYLYYYNNSFIQNVNRPSDSTLTLNIYSVNTYPPQPAVMLGKWIPGRITKPLIRLYPVVAPGGQADISRGRSTPHTGGPMHLPQASPHTISCGNPPMAIKYASIMTPPDRDSRTPSDNPDEFSQQTEPLLKPGRIDPIIWCITFLAIWYIISRLG